jgi:Na+/proline symporter
VSIISFSSTDKTTIVVVVLMVVVVVVDPSLTVVGEDGGVEDSITSVDEPPKRTSPRSSPAMKPTNTPVPISKYWVGTLFLFATEHPLHDVEPQTGQCG